MYLQKVDKNQKKNLKKKNYFVGFLKVTDQNSKIRIQIRNLVMRFQVRIKMSWKHCSLIYVHRLSLMNSMNESKTSFSSFLKAFGRNVYICGWNGAGVGDVYRAVPEDLGGGRSGQVRGLVPQLSP
jgi:hypothetical protein